MENNTIFSKCILNNLSIIVEDLNSEEEKWLTISYYGDELFNNFCNNILEVEEKIIETIKKL